MEWKEERGSKQTETIVKAEYRILVSQIGDKKNFGLLLQAREMMGIKGTFLSEEEAMQAAEEDAKKRGVQ